MHNDNFDFDACLARIKEGWTVGRTCRFSARAMASRVREARREFLAGRMPLERARTISREATEVAFHFGPVAGGGSHGRH